MRLSVDELAEGLAALSHAITDGIFNFTNVLFRLLDIKRHEFLLKLLVLLGLWDLNRDGRRVFSAGEQLHH